MLKKHEPIQKKAAFLITATFYCSIIAIIFVTIKFVIPFMLPFIIGFSIALILKPLTKTLSKKTSISHKICGAFVIILAYSMLTTSIWFICLKIVSTIQSFATNNQGIFVNKIMPTIKNLSSNFGNFCDSIAPNLGFKTEEILEKIASSMDKTIADTSKLLIIYIAKLGATIPNFLINLTFAITSSIYISTDYLNIAQYVNNIIPQKFQKLIKTTKKCASTYIIKYMKSYLILMLISFTCLSIGFLITKIDNPIGIAAITSICEFIPLFGASIIIVPWILTLILLKNFSLAIKIGIISAIVCLLRGFLEPRILGKQIGLHPLVTLLSFYTGMKLFGFLGLILLPTIAQIGFSIYKEYKNEFKKVL